MRRASLVLFSALLCYGLETRASWEVVPLAATPDAIGHAERDVRDAADHSSEGYVGPVTTSPLLAQQDAATAIEPSRQPQALLDAIRRDDTKRLRSLLRLGINPDTRDQDGTPALMLASLFGSPDALRLLLDRGANPNTTNATGATALMWAIPDLTKVELLLDRGADVNLRSTTALDSH